MDILEILKLHNLSKDDKIINLALTDSSYKCLILRLYSITDEADNVVLATLGDAILKYIQTIHLYDMDTFLLTGRRQWIENNEFLFKKALEINLPSHMLCDTFDQNRVFNQSKDMSIKYTKKYKYISTCLEAIIGAVFLAKDKDIDSVERFIKELGLLPD